MGTCASSVSQAELVEAFLAHDLESTLDRKAGILLPVQHAFGTVVDVHVIDIRIHHPTEGRLAIDLLDRQDVGVEEPHIAPYPLIICGGAFHRGIRPRRGD